MKVVVLAGGKGTRLGLPDRPKALAPLAGRPLLDHIIETARSGGFEEFVFLTGYRGDQIAERYGDGSAWGAHITHVRETVALGTAGAVREARALLTDPFIVIYGDTLLDVDLRALADFHSRSGALGTLFVHPNDHPRDSDLLEVGAAGRITRFLSKPHRPGALLPNLVSAALYVLEPQAIEYVPEQGAADWGGDVFPSMLARGAPLAAYRSLEYIKDVGTPERLARAETDLASGRVARMSRRQLKPAIFLDRDGVINVEIDGVYRPEDLVLSPGVGPAIQAANRAGVPVICVTNQPGLAKGFMTVSDLQAVMAALDGKLAEDGAYLDDVFVCPHHPEAGWPGEVAELKVRCTCRKPEPGMLKIAADRHGLDLAASWLIGDRVTDVMAAHAAGARAVLIGDGKGGDRDIRPEAYSSDPAAAVLDVLGQLA